MAIFTDVFLYGVIVPVLPFALRSRADIETGNVQRWVSTLLAVYSAGLLATSPPLGWVADKVNTRRSPLMAGLVLLTGATLMLCLGRSTTMFVIGRLLQGFSASIVWITGLALLVDTVGSEQIGETMGIVSLAYSVGILIAPLLGGVVYAGWGYYSVYYMAFVLIFIDAVLRLTFIERSVAQQYLPDDSIFMEANLRTLAQSDSPRAGNNEDEPRSSKLPPIFHLASSKRMLTAFWGILIVASLMTSFDSTLPLYANKVFGFNSLGSGLLFLALLLPSALGPVVGKASDKYGPRWLAVSGLVLSLPFLVLLRLVNHKTIGQIVLLCALLAFIGFCMALSMPPLMAEFTNITEAKQRHHPGLFGPRGAYAQAYGIFNSAWAAGSIVGPLWAGFIQEKTSWGTMTWTLGLLSIVSAIPVSIFTGGFITRRHESS